MPSSGCLDDSSASSGSLRNVNTRSAPAAQRCRFWNACANCESGCVKKRMYSMNATMTPNSMRPLIASHAPTTHTTTYPRLPTRFIIGIIKPERNWLFHPDSYRSLL